MPEQTAPTRDLSARQDRAVTFAARFAEGEAGAGTFEGIAARFGEADAYGDLLVPGAFAASLAEHQARGTWPAMLWQHREPAGVWTDIAETPEGLRVRGAFNLDTVTGREAYAHLKGGSSRGLSIGFFYRDYTANPDGTVTVRAVDLLEISLTPTPAAPRARVTKVRTAAPAANREDTMPAPNTAAETADHAEELRALSARLEELETRAARPGAAARGGTGTPEEAERRAIATFARTGDLAELRTVSTDSDPDGGYLVLPFLEAGVRTIARDRSPMRTLASAVTVDTDAYEIIVDPSEAGAVWVTERGARPETSTPELKKIRIPVGELYASPKTTQRTLDDARIDVAAWLTSQVGNKFAIAEGAAFVTGSGLDGRPKGILSYPTADTADFVRDWGVLQHVTSSTDDPTSLDFVTALIELSMSLRTPYRSNAAWLMSRSVLTSLRKITDENGAMLFSNDGRIVSGEPDRLLGFPIYMDEGMPAASPGNLPIAFGDFSQGYTIVDRFGMRTTVDAVTQKGFVLFDTYKRVGGGVVDFNAIKLLRIAP